MWLPAEPALSCETWIIFLIIVRQVQLVGLSTKKERKRWDEGREKEGREWKNGGNERMEGMKEGREWKKGGNIIWSIQTSLVITLDISSAITYPMTSLRLDMNKNDYEGNTKRMLREVTNDDCTQLIPYRHDRSQDQDQDSGPTLALLLTWDWNPIYPSSLSTTVNTSST